ncbi:hypothetical protein K491DRAFT_760981 [Lophiostoma macrostomum CBS 122681]|uniref:Uncharacterized protein n=1 Tax=Lophiostoma macrostomum CBS 122681 TaxID=1314788 RepID=A0A6A6SWT2_9PLEO|nr:hypothetical protein K491DRAFT_760981 [Lophiostoma macrostomum CBS 122681]
MAPRHGIVVYPGAAIDYSALTRPALPSSLSTSSRSASLARRKTNVGGVAFIVILVLCLVGALSIAILVLVILRNKRARRKREAQPKQQSEGVPFVTPAPNNTSLGYQSDGVGAMSYDAGNGDGNGVRGGVQELPQDNYLKDGTGGMYPGPELQGEENEVPRVQQLDGFVAPPRIGESPVELPGQMGGRER